jgi:hypothetical protein
LAEGEADGEEGSGGVEEQPLRKKGKIHTVNEKNDFFIETSAES